MTDRRGFSRALASLSQSAGNFGDQIRTEREQRRQEEREDARNAELRQQALDDLKEKRDFDERIKAQDRDFEADFLNAQTLQEQRQNIIGEIASGKITAKAGQAQLDALERKAAPSDTGTLSLAPLEESQKGQPFMPLTEGPGMVPSFDLGAPEPLAPQPQQDLPFLLQREARRSDRQEERSGRLKESFDAIRDLDGTQEERLAVIAAVRAANTVTRPDGTTKINRRLEQMLDAAEAAAGNIRTADQEDQAAVDAALAKKPIEPDPQPDDREFISFEDWKLDRQNMTVNQQRQENDSFKDDLRRNNERFSPMAIAGKNLMDIVGQGDKALFGPNGIAAMYQFLKSMDGSVVRASEIELMRQSLTVLRRMGLNVENFMGSMREGTEEGDKRARSEMAKILTADQVGSIRDVAMLMISNGRKVYDLARHPETMKKVRFMNGGEDPIGDIYGALAFDEVLEDPLDLSEEEQNILLRYGDTPADQGVGGSP